MIDCFIKTCKPFKRIAILKTLVLFLEESMLFLSVSKQKLYGKTFSNVKTKINSNFAVKVARSSNHSFLMSIQWNERSSQHCILMSFCTEFSKAKVFPCEYR